MWRTDGKTSCHGTVRAMHTRRAVKTTTTKESSTKSILLLRWRERVCVSLSVSWNVTCDCLVAALRTGTHSALSEAVLCPIQESPEKSGVVYFFLVLMWRRWVDIAASLVKSEAVLCPREISLIEMLSSPEKLSPLQLISYLLIYNVSVCRRASVPARILETVRA